MTQESVPMGRRADTAGDRVAARPHSTPAPVLAPLRPAHPNSKMITWGAFGLGYSLIAGSFARLTIPAEIRTLPPGAALDLYELYLPPAHTLAPDPLAR